MDRTQTPVFHKVNSSEDVSEVYNHNVEVFLESFDFDWNPSAIMDQLKQGWRFYSVKIGEEIIAALFVYKTGKKLMSQHSNIKMEHRGNGHSHRLKEFIEDLAKQEGLEVVENICRQNDFRLISLNETHHYKRVEDSDQGDFILWRKKL
jgi:predicted GNAT family acetyltransferase